MKVGIVGGGQLAQMLVQAGTPLGLEFSCYEKNKDCPAGSVAPIFLGDYQDAEALKNFSQQVDVVTYEFENLAVEALSKITAPIAPNLTALAIAQDRWLEKEYFSQCKIPSTQYFNVQTYEELCKAVEVLQKPCILKTRRMGYDGKGQFVIREQKDILSAWESLAGHALIVENFVAFDFEVSQIAVRNKKGEIRFYPLVKNDHQDGILSLSLAPYENEELSKQAQNYVASLLNHLDYVGVLTVEFFVKGSQLYANEMAPRVHNSGHWTIEGAQTSQFENHLRAVTGLALGSTEAKGFSAMVNLIGKLPDKNKLMQSFPKMHWHDYGKTPREKRKLGHITLCDQNKKKLMQQVSAILEIVNL